MGLILGFLVLFIYRRKKLFIEDIGPKRGKMKVSTFFALLILLLTPSTFVSLFSFGSEAFLNLFGLTVNEGINSVLSSEGMQVSMFLYVILFGPIMEEILFRGVLLHRLEKYGKVFAIVVSAISFGVFHGNLTQGIFAIIIGLLLGYVALEYSLKWCIILHVFNNSLSMGQDLLMNYYSDIQVEFICFVVLAVISVLGILLLIKKKTILVEYKEENPTVPGSKALVYGNPWFIVFLCFCFVAVVFYMYSSISFLP